MKREEESPYIHTYIVRKPYVNIHSVGSYTIFKVCFSLFG